MTFKLIISFLFILAIINKSYQEEIDCLFVNCSCEKESNTHYKNIVVSINCDGFKSNLSSQFPERASKFTYPNRIKNLIFNNYDLKSLPDEAFNKLIIENLDLKRNNLTTLNSNIFSGINGLEVLDLSENNLTKISNQVFYKLNGLRVLNLSKNKILTVQSEAFKNLSGLNTLDLSQNQINLIDSKVFEPVANSLESLQLSNNQLSNFPTFPIMTEINYIDLSNNSIITLENFVIPYTITALILSNNKINQISTQPLASLSNLVLLDLSKNQITNIDESAFKYLKQLRILRLSSNKLRSFPNLMNLVNLVEIDLSKQEGYNKLKNVQEYSLDRSDFDKNSPLSNIKRLDLSQNGIESFDNRAFCSRQGTYEIEYLILNNNPIKKLDPCLFSNLKRTKMTIFFYSNNTTNTTQDNNCNCEVVNYLAGFSINLLSDCDLNETTKCSRKPPIETELCSDIESYDCQVNLLSELSNKSIKFSFSFILYLGLIFLNLFIEIFFN